MKRSRNFLACAGLMLAVGMSAPAFGADAISFDPDGAGGDPVINNVLSFDWTPANTLAVGGSAAVATFLNTATIIPAGGGFVATGGVQTPFSVFYQSKLAGFNLVGGLPGSPFTPAGLNTTYEITAVARFDEVVSSVLVDASGNALVSFAHATNAAEYLEIWHGTGANFDASDSAGTGFNNGTLILESDILSTTFISNFQALAGATVDLDQANGDQLGGQQTIEGAGTTLFDGAVTAFDSSYFVDVLSTVGFFNTTNGNQKLPFEEAEPSRAFLVTSAGTSSGVAPTLAGAGAPGDATLGIGTINGGQSGAPGSVVASGPSIQFQADVNSSFERVTFVVPEPATAVLALGGLLGLGMRRRRMA